MNTTRTEPGSANAFFYADLPLRNLSVSYNERRRCEKLRLFSGVEMRMNVSGRRTFDRSVLFFESNDAHRTAAGVC